jgi:hypothetical protein
MLRPFECVSTSHLRHSIRWIWRVVGNALRCQCENQIQRTSHIPIRIYTAYLVPGAVWMFNDTSSLLRSKHLLFARDSPACLGIYHELETVWKRCRQKHTPCEIRTRVPRARPAFSSILVCACDPKCMQFLISLLPKTSISDKTKAPGRCTVCGRECS